MNANVIRKLTDQACHGMPPEWSLRPSMVQGIGINPRTFYNWVGKLRKAGYTIPDSESKVCGTPVRQEVVRLDLVRHERSTPAMVGQNTSHLVSATIPCIAVEIECENIWIRFFNGGDDIVIQNRLKCIGGMSHAW